MQRLGGVAKPEAIGAGLVILATWAEGRHHADAVQVGAIEDANFLRARVIQLERRADSTAVRVAYLEREAVRARRKASNVGIESPPFGPGWTPRERGTLMKSVGRIFRGLFFFAQTKPDEP